MKELVLPWPSKDLSLDAIEARRLFDYCPSTGLLTRRVRSGQRGTVGSIAGGVDKHGYVRLRFKSRKHSAHRLAWLIHCGQWPDGEVDHINGNRSDNRIENLRCVDKSTNLENQRRPRADNSLGVLGVRERKGRFESRIWVKGSPMYLGRFPTAEEAHEAYVKAKRSLHVGGTL